MRSRSNTDQLEAEGAGATRSRFWPSPRAITRRATGWDARPLRVVTFGCEPFAKGEPQALGLTYWLDAAAKGTPYRVTVRFDGRRKGVKGKPRPHDRFSVLESVDPVVPGSGPIAVTARVFDVAPGEW